MGSRTKIFANPAAIFGFFWGHFAPPPQPVTHETCVKRGHRFLIGLGVPFTSPMHDWTLFLHVFTIWRYIGRTHKYPESMPTNRYSACIVLIPRQTIPNLELNRFDWRRLGVVKHVKTLPFLLKRPLGCHPRKTTKAHMFGPFFSTDFHRCPCFFAKNASFFLKQNPQIVGPATGILGGNSIGPIQFQGFIGTQYKDFLLRGSEYLVTRYM